MVPQRNVAILNNHIVTVKEGSRRLALYCLPGAGGETHWFREMAESMRDDRPVYAIGLSAFEGSTGDFRVEDVAKFCRQIIQERQSEGPYHLCGYSFGGLLAYEIANQMAELGAQVGLLALIDAPNPSLRSNLSPAESRRFKSAYLFDRLRRHALNALSGKLSIYFLTWRLQWLSWQIARRAFRALGRPIPRMFQNDFLMFSAAASRYVPKPYANRVVIFRAEDRGPEFDQHHSLGWSSCAIGGVDVHVVPGGHVNMLAKPYVSTMAATLERYLTREDKER